MNKPKEVVLLRDKSSKHSRPFAADHAERLLAYPNTQWEQVAESEPAEKKPQAAAKKGAAAAALPEADATGHPEAI